MKTILRLMTVLTLLCACSSAIFAAGGNTDPKLTLTAKRADGTLYNISKNFYRSPTILTSRTGAPLTASMNFAGYPGFVDWTAAQKADLDRYEDSVLGSNAHRVISATLGFGSTDLFWRPIDETQLITPWPYVWECDWLNLAWPLNYGPEYYATCIIWNGQVSYGTLDIQVGDMVGPVLLPDPIAGCGGPNAVVVAINPNNPYDFTVRKKEGGYGLYDEHQTIHFTAPNLTVGMGVWRSYYGVEYVASPQYPPYLFW